MVTNVQTVTGSWDSVTFQQKGSNLGIERRDLMELINRLLLSGRFEPTYSRLVKYCVPKRNNTYRRKLILEPAT